MKHFGDVSLQNFPGLVEQGQICGVTNVVRRAGCIQNQCSIVAATFFGWVLLIVIILVDATKNVINPGHPFRFDPFAKVDESGSTDWWRWLEFREAKEALNVWVLCDRLGAFAVTKVEHRLDKKGSKSQSGRLGDIAFEACEFAGIFLLDLVPRDDLSQFDPTIVGIELAIPWRHEFKYADLIFLFQIHSSFLRSAGFSLVFGDFRPLIIPLSAVNVLFAGVCGLLSKPYLKKSGENIAGTHC